MEIGTTNFRTSDLKVWACSAPACICNTLVAFGQHLLYACYGPRKVLLPLSWWVELRVRCPIILHFPVETSKRFWKHSHAILDIKIWALWPYIKDEMYVICLSIPLDVTPDETVHIQPNEVGRCSSRCSFEWTSSNYISSDPEFSSRQLASEIDVKKGKVLSILHENLLHLYHFTKGFAMIVLQDCSSVAGCSTVI